MERGAAAPRCGNRTRHTENGSTTDYALAATSHRLTALSGAESRSFTYDATGNVTAEGPGMVHVHDASGRRVKTTVGGQAWSYGYDALGERLKKSGSSTTLYAYDEDHHLLGEYSATGKLIQETVWLGEMPVATLRLPAGATSGPANVFYVHADHLNTPRRVTRPADHKVLWQWQGEPFGNSLANENPQGAGVFRYALRFPGQVFDPESGLSYNYFRDYDSNTGRYRQSDPIGLAGGSWSTYGYVGGNPVSRIDPQGLAAITIPVPDIPLPSWIRIPGARILGGLGLILSLGGDTRQTAWDCFDKCARARDAAALSCSQMWGNDGINPNDDQFGRCVALVMATWRDCVRKCEQNTCD